ncbi:MAG: hypothetical protein QMD86_00390 [Patescibacteria group bacterium]|nr:hypothetical protein [Patescibacteria group bacterium]
MPENHIGKVIHYYDKAMVAVIKLTGALFVGDTVKFNHHNNEFIETVESMEVDRQKIQSAKTGDEVAVKVNQKTHEGADVYKIA